MKRIWMIVFLGILTLKLQVYAESIESGDYIYSVKADGTAVIDEYIGKEEEIIIPQYIDGIEVTEIGEDSFLCNHAVNIEIPNGIKKIDDYAFELSFKLTSVSLPSSITEVGENPFKLCESLENITIENNNSRLTLLDGVLYDWKDKKLIWYPQNRKDESYKIPDCVERIGGSAFQACKSIKEIVIPDSVIALGDRAFKQCSLSHIEISDKVIEIGDNPFANCRQLKQIDVSKDNLRYTSIDGVLYDRENEHLISYPTGNMEERYIIADGTTSIGKEAFMGCYELRNVEIPESVTEIGDSAFNFCGLESIELPERITEISPYAFWGCSKMHHVKFPKELIKIREGAFEGCESLEDIELPRGVSEMDGYAFQNCRSLINIELPDGLEKIGASCFLDCSSLVSMSIPDSVNSIGKWAFGYCDNLTLIVGRDSYAEVYAKMEEIPYIFSNYDNEDT